jgi:hypothetical protein
MHTGSHQLLQCITVTDTYIQGRTQAIKVCLIEAYWQVGLNILEFEQEGKSALILESAYQNASQ